MKGIDKEKLVNYGQQVLRWLPITSIVLTVIVFMILTYYSVVPRVDDAVRAEGSIEVQSLDIRFNSKLLSDLANTSQPSTVDGSGGRDPFSPF